MVRWSQGGISSLHLNARGSQHGGSAQGCSRSDCRDGRAHQQGQCFLWYSLFICKVQKVSCSSPWVSLPSRTHNWKTSRYPVIKSLSAQGTQGGLHPQWRTLSDSIHGKLDWLSILFISWEEKVSHGNYGILELASSRVFWIKDTEKMMNNLHEMQVSSQGKTAAQPQEGPESRKAFI